MDRSDAHDVLPEIEQQIAAAAARLQRLREVIATLEAKGEPADDHLDLLQALGAAQSMLIERRDRLARRIRERS